MSDYAEGMRRAAEMCLVTRDEALAESGHCSREIAAWMKGQADAILAAIPASAPWTPPDCFCECLGWVRGEWLHVVRMGRDKPWQWVSEEGDTVSPTAFASLPPTPEAKP